MAGIGPGYGDDETTGDANFLEHEATMNNPPDENDDGKEEEKKDDVGK